MVWIVRLTNHFAEIEAPDYEAALAEAMRNFGREHKIRTIYPKDPFKRMEFAFDMAARD
jgi:hypothetical protein